jgi:lysophospholipase L1-like esterase
VSATVVCAGDSITRGQYGVDYVRMLQARLRGRGVAVSAAAVNGDVSYGLLARLTPIVDQKPSAITVLVGTNDLWGSLSEANAQKLVDRWKLPYPPGPHEFGSHLEQIVMRLKAETDARIALLSPPALGQNLASAAIHAGQRFAHIVNSVAQNAGVAYLPLFERQLDHLRSAGGPDLPLPAGLAERYTSVLQHYLLGRSYDRIAHARRLILTTDHVHQNTAGATMIADLVEQFLCVEVAG